MEKFKKSELLQALDTVFKAEFKAGLELKEPQWKVVAMEISSTTKLNTYGFLGNFPKMREWIGERQIKKMQAQGMTIENKLFEATVSVPRTDIEDDQVGLFAPVAKEAGQSAAELPDDLVYSLLPKGKSTLCYDGQNFFDTDHPVYAEVDGTGAVTQQSNLTTGSASGKPAYYILDDTRVIKPMIWQKRTKPEIEPKFDPSKSDKVFMEDVYLWGARARGNAGFGFWQLIHRVENSDLNAETVMQVIAKMKTLKTDGDKKLNIRPSVLLVPATLEFEAKKLVESELINGSSNPLKGVLKVEVCAWLDD